MGQLGKNMSQVFGQITNAQKEYLDLRIQNAGTNQSVAIRSIFNLWISLGAPALTDLETFKALPAVPHAAGVSLPQPCALLPLYWERVFKSTPPPTAEGHIPSSPDRHILARQDTRRAERGAKVSSEPKRS